jgi:putative membrane protein
MSDPIPKPKEESIRVHQANERTMLAWIRTGISLMAFGFAIAKFAVFLRQIAANEGARPPTSRLGSNWIGAALVALGMLANLLATIRYGRVRRAIERGDVGPPNALLVYVFGFTATLIGLAMTILLAHALQEE